MKPPIHQHFAFPAVAKAAGVKYDTMKGWAVRKQLVMRDEDRATLGRGGQRQVSFNTAVQAIIMAELNKFQPLAVAAEGAKQFAHVGDDAREAGGLYQDAETFIACSQQAVLAILKVRKADSFLGVFSKACPREAFSGLIFVNANSLLLHAAPVLGMDDAWIREASED